MRKNEEGEAEEMCRSLRGTFLEAVRETYVQVVFVIRKEERGTNVCRMLIEIIRRIRIKRKEVKLKVQGAKEREVK